MAGAPCPEETVRRAVGRLHLPELTIAYGMTETGPVSFQSSGDDPLARRVSTVGRVQPHLEAKVIDADGCIVPIGQPGELCTRGYAVMQGYWNDAERSAEVLRDGWMHTGDLATLDAEGYCRIVGRVQDLVLRDGESVNACEVEGVLARHPKVAAAQVFGVPDERHGEEVCAWIITRSGMACSEDELRAWCRAHGADGLVPCYIRFVEELPATVSGKPQKFAMRDRMMQELGLGIAAGA
jgi:fatty-acyl-CoA synthase